MKRVFDFFVSFLALFFLFPLFFFLMIAIMLNSKGAIFFKQSRVGQYGKDFKVFKFRSMYVDSEIKGMLTVGERDPRITSLGYYLRKYKLDELPQLINVVKGEMSLVGPRPEVRKYVDMYSVEQAKVLLLKPGITDMASIKYKDENAILQKYSDPEEAYLKYILPDKIVINLASFKDSQSVFGSIKIIFLTIFEVFGKKITINE